MKLTHTHIYKQPIDAIYASCMNESFIKAKMQALGARNIEVSISKKETTTTVEIIREIPIEVPNSLKSLIQPWSKMTQTEVWRNGANDSYYCNITIDLKGAPLNIKSQMKLATTEGGTAAVAITEVTCTIPFIGKTLANFIGDTSREAIEKEFAYMDRHVWRAD